MDWNWYIGNTKSMLKKKKVGLILCLRKEFCSIHNASVCSAVNEAEASDGNV